MKAEEFIIEEQNEVKNLFKDWSIGKLASVMEAYHQSRVNAISDERPNIKDTLGDISLSEVHAEYQKAPLLYMHIKLLDKFIDELLKQ